MCLSHPETTALPTRGKIVFHEISPSCQKRLGTAGPEHTAASSKPGVEGDGELKGTKNIFSLYHVEFLAETSLIKVRATREKQTEIH